MPDPTTAQPDNQTQPLMDVFSPPDASTGQRTKGKIPFDLYRQYRQAGQDFVPAVRVTSPEGQGGWVPSDLAHDFITSKGFKLGPPDQQNLGDGEPSMLSKVYDWASKGLISGKDLFNYAANKIANQHIVPVASFTEQGMGQEAPEKDYYTAAKKYAQSGVTPTDIALNDSPTVTGIRHGLAGALTDTADTASPLLTSPISLAAGAAGAAPAVLEEIPALRAAVPAAKAVLRGTQAAGGLGFGAQGAENIYDAATDSSKPAPERLQEGLQGASMLAGGIAGAGESGVGRLPEEVASRTTSLVRGGVRAVRTATNPVAAAESLPAEDLATRATKPRNSIQNFKQQMATALPDARRAADSLGLNVTNLEDANAATGQAKRDIWQEYEANHLQPGVEQGLTIDGNKVADAMVGTINKRFELQNPQAAQAIRDLADQYRRPIPVAEAEDFLQSANNDLASYYAKNKVSQRTASLDPVKGHVVAEANALRSELYKTLNDLSGSDAAALKRRYGALTTLEDVINRRINVAERQAPESLIEQISKLEAAKGMAKGAFKIATGRPFAGAADIVGARQGLKAARLARQANDSNFLISKAFEKTQPSPATTIRPPTPPSPIAGFLNPAPTELPPPSEPLNPNPEGLLNPGKIIVRDPKTGRAKVFYTNAPAEEAGPTQYQMGANRQSPIQELLNPSTPAPERRSNLDLRAAVDAMTPEQRQAAIFTHKNSGLPNDRAFDVARGQLAATHPVVGFADIDNFKSYNTALGEPGVDRVVFPAIGDAMRDAAAAENGAVHPFHLHGDEMGFLGTDTDAVNRVVDRVNKQLADAEFTVQKPDGSISTKKGVQFSHGTGPDLETASAAESAVKQARKAAAAAQNQTPIPPAGQQTAINQNAERQGVRGAATQEQANPLADLLSGKSQEQPVNPRRTLGAKPKGFSAKGGKGNQGGFAKLDVPGAIAEGAGKLADIFFSKAERAAEEKLPNVVSASAVLPTLRNAGVKEEELKWLGLADYLQGKDKVSKQDLLNFIRSNNVQVKEVMHSDKDVKPLAWQETKTGYGKQMWVTNAGRIDYAVIKSGNHFNLDRGSKHIGVFDSLDEAQQAAHQDAAQTRAGSTKFSQYQLPGGSNYRELLLTLPEDRQPLKPYDEWRKENMGGAADSQQLRDLYAEQKGQANTPSFRSSHFDEPNVLAHIRFNDRISPDGKKTLFIEEVQSDWHQKGRKEGYASGPRFAVYDKAGQPTYDLTRQQADDLAARNPGSRVEPDPFKPTSGVPDAPFKTTWHELAMKRMLRYAAEHGYDRVAWTTGEQQAARYDLSKHVNQVLYDPSQQTLIGRKNGSQEFSQHVPPDKVADYVGKDVAQKLLNAPKNEYGFHSLEGEDLKLGAKGMAGFYDKILPDFMNKYGKKWGARVQDTEIPSGSSDKRVLDIILREDFGTDWGSATPEQRQKAIDIQDGKAKLLTVPVHSIDITPEMRKDVLFKGQPISKNVVPHSPLQQLFSGGLSA